MDDPRFTVAVIMAVWRGDQPQRLVDAACSINRQQGLAGVDVRLYLGVDGPVGPELEAALLKLEPGIYRLTRFATNRGLAPVLNDLIASLEDEAFVFRMDADDVSFPERMATQLDYLEANPEVDILGAAICERTADGVQRIVGYPENHDEIVRALIWRNPLAHPTVCFRRRVLDAVGGYPLANLTEDLAMWFRCVEAGFRFANITRPLLFFTIDEHFWKRRSSARAWREYAVWTAGIWRMHGVSWRLAMPLARLVFRFSPEAVRRWAYGSPMRRSPT